MGNDWEKYTTIVTMRDFIEACKSQQRGASCARSCPIAQSIKRTYDVKHVRVLGYNLAEIGSSSRYEVFKLDKKGREVMNLFDGDLLMVDQYGWKKLVAKLPIKVTFW